MSEVVMMEEIGPDDEFISLEAYTHLWGPEFHLFFVADRHDEMQKMKKFQPIMQEPEPIRLPKTMIISEKEKEPPYPWMEDIIHPDGEIKKKVTEGHLDLKMFFDENAVRKDLHKHRTIEIRFLDDDRPRRVLYARRDGSVVEITAAYETKRTLDETLNEYPYLKAAKYLGIGKCLRVDTIG